MKKLNQIQRNFSKSLKVLTPGTLLIVVLASAVLIVVIFLSRKAGNLRFFRNNSNRFANSKSKLCEPQSGNDERVSYQKMLRQNAESYGTGINDLDLYYPSSKYSEQDAQFMKNASRVINENINNPYYSINMFCKSMNMERSGVYRYIKRITNSTPMNYLKIVRLDKAVRRINDDISVSDSVLAESLGFKSVSAFRNSFFSYLEMTTEDYRKSIERRRKSI